MHLGREPHERAPGAANHRNGDRSRRFTLKGFGTYFSMRRGKKIEKQCVLVVVGVTVSVRRAA